MMTDAELRDYKLNMMYFFEVTSPARKRRMARPLAAEEMWKPYDTSFH